MNNIEPFEDPIYVTQPILPKLENLVEKLKEVWGSKRLTNNGPQHKRLEERLCDILKVPYLSLFNNGTIALIVACQSLRLTGEVITTPFTFAATPHVLTWNNISPIFCDIDPVTMNIDADKIESMITPQTTGILAVHVYGTPCDVKKIQEIANRYGLKVVYDAAHAFGVEIDGKGIGTFGDVSMFSFHATKLFHTAEGGALTFNDKNMKDRVDLLKNFGIKNEEEVMMPGINGKMNELQALLGLEVLGLVEEEKKKRRNIFLAYSNYLNGIEGIKICNNNSEDVNHNYQYVVIRVNEKEYGVSRDYLYTELKKYNVHTRKYFYPLCSSFACYKHLFSSIPANLPIADKVSTEVLCLPIYGELNGYVIQNICNIISDLKQ
ncbi:MAG: putative PLP-dependent [Geobacteraceae bacterium]|nr:MAG: putative PLP-dependent [Geobacteraceae bacterium]